MLTCLARLLAGSFAVFLLTDRCFADRTGVFAFKPLSDAVLMESVKAWDNDEVFPNFKVALANRTHLVVFTEVLLVCFRELLERKRFDDLLRNGLALLFIKSQ